MRQAYPSRALRSAEIARIADLSADDEIHICGRLVAWDSAQRRGVLRDASGEIACSFAGWRGAVAAGDILELAGRPGRDFTVTGARRLAPGRLPAGSTRAYIQWREVLADRRRLHLLGLRSDFLRRVRAFFYDRGFIEIDAPALVPAAGMEPHIEPFVTAMPGPGAGESRFFLHTSPEFTLKKMLTAGCERVFYLGHAFRSGETGPHHAPEFAMLEWYRAYADYEVLMADCRELLHDLDESLSESWAGLWRRDDLLRRECRIVSLARVMQEVCAVDLAAVGEDGQVLLIEALRRNGLSEGREDWPVDDLFFLLFLNRVESGLGRGAPLILRDYPAWMASLAKAKADDPCVVERFELYIDGIELANAFTELNDPAEQHRRLLAEQDRRRRLGRTQVPVDEDFLAALTSGMPPAAGIALGLDRLLMVCCGLDSLDGLLFWGPPRE